MKLARLILLFVILTVELRTSSALRECTKAHPCVRFCCANCTKDFDVKDQPGAEKMITDYQALFGRPCGEMYVLEPAEYPYDRWTLTEVKVFRF